MKKTQFLKELRHSLIERGFAPDTVDNEIASVSAYFDEEKLDDIEIPVSEMADEISALITEQSTADAPSEEAEAAPEEDKNMPDGFAHFELDADSVKAPDSSSSESEDDDVSGNAETDDGVSELNDGIKISSPASAFRSEDKKPVQPEENKAENDNLNFDDEDVRVYENSGSRGLFGKKDKAEKNVPAATPEKDKELDEFSYAEFDEEKVKSPAFTVMLIFALPIIAFLALVAVAVYLGFWVFLALVLIAVVAFLIAFVAVGVTIALVGLVYGAIMMIKGNVPVGLFEIGLGITVGAAVLFLGILIYNFAVRLIPFAMKMLAKLLGFAFVKVKEGLKAVKKMLVRAERGQNQ